MNLGIGGGNLGSRPKALMCYICGREYGTTSLQIHLKTCMKKWEIEEAKKPKKDRRPMPQPPKQLLGVLNQINSGGNVNWEEMESYNTKANDEWNDAALIRCEYCNRTFLPDRMPIHRKVCSAEKPFKPLPPPANRGGASTTSTTGGSNLTSNSTTSKGMGGGMGGGKGDKFSMMEEAPSTKAGGVQPKKAVQQKYDDEAEGDYYGAPTKATETYKASKPTTQSKPMTQAKPSATSYGNYGGGGDAEYENVQLAECDICGRKFAADRLDRHQVACVKAQKAEAKHVKKVALAEKKQLETEKFIAKEAKFKKNNWRQQHEEFVKNLQYNRKLQAVEDAGGDVRSLGPPPKMTALESNMVECPYCARKFNPTSAEKHISICKNVVNKPKAVPGKPTPSTSTYTASPSKTTSKMGGPSPYANQHDDGPSYNASKYGASMGGNKGLVSNVRASNEYGGAQPSMATKGGGYGMKSNPLASPSGAGKGMMSSPSKGTTGIPKKTANTGYRY